MAFYSYIFTANYGRFFRSLHEVAKREKRFFPALILDTGWCVFRYGMALTDYLNYQLYNRSAAERKRYAGVRLQNEFYAVVSPAAHKQIFSDKVQFLTRFAPYTGRAFVFPARSEYAEVETFLNANPVFIAKPVDGIGGKGVEKLRTAEIPDLRAFYDRCVRERILLEELVIQREEMNALCATSVNTLRVMTFNDHGTPRILWAGLRVGNGINAIDNFHAQGMGVSIDMETGRLVGNATNKDLQEFTHHPTSGVRFDGFAIPCFDEVKKLVLEAATVSDKILVVGWDVALSEKGPVLIEGNRRPGFDLVQVLDHRGRRDIMEDVLACLDRETTPA